MQHFCRQPPLGRYQNTVWCTVCREPALDTDVTSNADPGRTSLNMHQTRSTSTRHLVKKNMDHWKYKYLFLTLYLLNYFAMLVNKAATGDECHCAQQMHYVIKMQTLCPNIISVWWLHLYHIVCLLGQQLVMIPVIARQTSMAYFYRLVQERYNPSALAMESCLSCTKSLILFSNSTPV